MLFNDTDRKNLVAWGGGDTKKLTIKRLGYIAMLSVDPNLRAKVCATRNKLIEQVGDWQYRTYYDNVIRHKQLHESTKDQP